jgi:cytochrome P450
MDAAVAQGLAEVTPAGIAKCAAAMVGVLVLKLVASEVFVSLRCRHIPCPKGRIPLLGHALTLLKGNVWDTFTNYATQYGSIYRMHVLGRVFIVLADPQHIKHVLSTNIKNYRKDRGAYGVFDCLLGTGIVTSEGDRWHRLRRELAPTFKLEILEDVANAAEEVTKRLYEQLDAACKSGEIVDMAEHFRKLTLQVIALAVLGCTPKESDEEISDLYMPIIDECNDRIWYPHRIYLPTPAWWRHNSLVRSLNLYLEGKIKKRWAERMRREEQKIPHEAPKDILDRILANVDPVEFRKNGVRDLRDGLKTFLFAGHDTTSCMLTWTLWELMQTPEAEKTAQKEVDAFFGGANPDFEAVQSCLPYVFNCLRETLRLHSPVPVVTREIIESDVIGGVAVPPGAIALICMDAVHKRSDLWPQGDTSVFRPTRWA